jgi:hypothetical protein
MSSTAVAFFDSEYLIFFFNRRSHSDVLEKICYNFNKCALAEATSLTVADNEPTQRVPDSPAGLAANAAEILARNLRAQL